MYPIAERAERTGLIVSDDGHGRLLISGAANDLIELADLLVSLALSGANRGQHWHIDDLTLMDRTSPVSELILTRR